MQAVGARRAQGDGCVPPVEGEETEAQRGEVTSDLTVMLSHPPLSPARSLRIMGQSALNNCPTMFFWQHHPKICMLYILLIDASHNHVFVVTDFVGSE